MTETQAPEEVELVASVNYDVPTLADCFPVGCTVRVKSDNGFVWICTAGSCSFCSQQAAFEVVGHGFGRLRDYLRVKLDKNRWDYSFGFLEANGSVEKADMETEHEAEHVEFSYDDL